MERVLEEAVEDAVGGRPRRREAGRRQRRGEAEPGDVDPERPPARPRLVLVAEVDVLPPEEADREGDRRRPPEERREVERAAARGDRIAQARDPDDELG